MLTYRVYALNKAGKIDEAPFDIACLDDDDAVVLAQTILSTGGRVEIWRGIERIWPSSNVQRVVGDVERMALSTGL